MAKRNTKLWIFGGLAALLLLPKRSDAAPAQEHDDWFDDYEPEPDRDDDRDDRDDRDDDDDDDERAEVTAFQHELNMIRLQILRGDMERGVQMREVFLPIQGCSRTGPLRIDGIVGPCTRRAEDLVEEILDELGLGSIPVDVIADTLKSNRDERALWAEAADDVLGSYSRPAIT